MTIERTDKEVIIRLPASVDIEELQDMVNYARYKELTSKFKVSQKEADKLIQEVKKGMSKSRSKSTKVLSLSK